MQSRHKQTNTSNNNHNIHNTSHIILCTPFPPPWLSSPVHHWWYLKTKLNNSTNGLLGWWWCVCDGMPTYFRVCAEYVAGEHRWWYQLQPSQPNWVTIPPSDEHATRWNNACITKWYLFARTRRSGTGGIQGSSGTIGPTTRRFSYQTTAQRGFLRTPRYRDEYFSTS